MLTDVAAIVGAITGVIALALSLLTYLRDRPRIRVKSVTRVDEQQRMFVEVKVWNEGRYSIALEGIGLAVCGCTGNSLGSWLWKSVLFALGVFPDREVRLRGVQYNELAVEDGVEQTVVLRPGEPAKCVLIDMQTAFSRSGSGRVAWPYAEAVGGRTVYADQPAHVQEPAN